MYSPDALHGPHLRRQRLELGVQTLDGFDDQAREVAVRERQPAALGLTWTASGRTFCTSCATSPVERRLTALALNANV
jgi:hypothetical protein